MFGAYYFGQPYFAQGSRGFNQFLQSLTSTVSSAVSFIRTVGKSITASGLAFTGLNKSINSRLLNNSSSAITMRRGIGKPIGAQIIEVVLLGNNFYL